MSFESKALRLARWKAENKREKLQKLLISGKLDTASFNRKKFGWVDENTWFKDTWTKHRPLFLTLTWAGSQLRARVVSWPASTGSQLPARAGSQLSVSIGSQFL